MTTRNKIIAAVVAAVLAAVAAFMSSYSGADAVVPAIETTAVEAVPAGDRFPRQDPQPSQHRREAPAAGRPHQGPH